MSIAGKLVIAALVGALAAIAIIFVIGENPSPLSLAVAFLAATIITVLATHKPLANPETAYHAGVQAQAKPRKEKQKTAARAPAPVPSGAARQEGEVKWFNASKGFGFITVDGGEEIFVHFRSIRGEGRRALNDGQRVSFVVAQTDKGPQAEDVEALDQG